MGDSRDFAIGLRRWAAGSRRRGRIACTVGSQRGPWRRSDDPSRCPGPRHLRLYPGADRRCVRPPTCRPDPGRDRGSPVVHRPVLFRDRLRQLRGLPGVTAPGQPDRLAIPGRRPRQRPAGLRGRVLDPRPGRRAGVPSVGRGGRRDPAVSGGRRVAGLHPTAPHALSHRPACVEAMVVGGLGVRRLALLYGPSFFLLPGTLTAAVRQSVSLHVSNPIGIPFGSDLNYLVQSPALLIPFALALLSVADRWRRSRGDERQQLNWLAAVCLLIALVLVPYVAVQSGISISLWVSWIFGSLLLLGFAFGIPGAMAVAILRYRLYEIDVVLNRALVYGALAAFISAVYVGIVVGIGTLIGSRGQPNLGLSIAATAMVAVAFQPVPERIERMANHIVSGHRATPYEVLAQFSHRVAGAYANEEVLPR